MKEHWAEYQQELDLINVVYGDRNKLHDLLGAVLSSSPCSCLLVFSVVSLGLGCLVAGGVLCRLVSGCVVLCCLVVL